MFYSTDQIGQVVTVSQIPRRIISLVPSQSEFLWDIGISEGRLVGITKFCIHPNEMFKQIIKVGGTKNISIEKIDRLQPDFILANKEENEMSAVLELKKKYPVWVSDIKNVGGAYQMMLEVGRICGLQRDAENIIQRINQVRKDFLLSQPIHSVRSSVAYFIWKKPLMVAGGNTFIDAMLSEAGFHNVFHDYERYPEVTNEILEEIKPYLIFLSSEPYPFSDDDMVAMQHQFPFAQVKIVDGEMFSWYGSRLESAYEYFKKLRTDLG